MDADASNFKWDAEVQGFCSENLSNVDTIVLGRNTAEDFIPFWEKVSKDPGHDDYKFGKLLTDIPKVVFSRKLESGKWANASVVAGNIEAEIRKLKNTPGREIIVYGGISFVSSLMKHQLIDQLYLLVNPVVFGKGETIYTSVKDNLQLRLETSKPFSCGSVLLSYALQK
jgi:dihydrofolate reductase